MGKLFVTVFALLLHPRQIRNGLAPGHAASAPQLKSCTVTDFWLRDKLYRDTAPVPTNKICNRG